MWQRVQGLLPSCGVVAVDAKAGIAEAEGIAEGEEDTASVVGASDMFDCLNSQNKRSRIAYALEGSKLLLRQLDMRDRLLARG